MPYTTNPQMPRIRREVAQLVYKGWSTRKVARHFGWSQSAVVKWFKKSKSYGYHAIPTLSSRPHHHPKELSDDIVNRIINTRLETKRTSEVVHQTLQNQGIRVSLNSVRRTIDRHGLMKKRSPWKRYHPHQERPVPMKAGDLIELDSIHIMVNEKKRIYVLVLIDVFSRWAYARAYKKLSGATTIQFVAEAESKAPFQFGMLQSDHGPEFSSWFVQRIESTHRYTRIGKPNDNAHIERFNRTLEEECLDKCQRNVRAINCELRKYLPYYNTTRLHLGISLRVPIQLTTKRFQAIG